LPGVVQIVPNDRKDAFADEIGLTTAQRFGEGDGACGASIAPGSLDERRTRFGCRPAATRNAPTASFLRRAGPGAASRSTRFAMRFRVCGRRASVRWPSRGSILVRTDGIFQKAQLY
jgi:hypothetical protein